MKKLEAYGINGPVREWIREYLRGRSQEVLVNGEKSKEAPVICSRIAQGTVLGPLLRSFSLSCRIFDEILTIC